MDTKLWQSLNRLLATIYQLDSKARSLPVHLALQLESELQLALGYLKTTNSQLRLEEISLTPEFHPDRQELFP